MNRQVKRIVRTLEVKAAQEHMRIITGKPFVAAPSEINGLMYSGLIALHKMRTRWVRRPRSRPARPGCAAKGGPSSSMSRRGTAYAFVVGFNEWVLKGWVAGQGWKRSKSKDANGWEHDGQILRELKAPEALAGMSGRHCKQLQYPGKHEASVERGPGSGR